MITLLKSGYWKIMQLFYKNKSSKLHLREIVRQTGLHAPSVTRFLRWLEKEHVLASEKDGNLKKYSILRNKRTYLLFEIFDIERFEKLPPQRKNAIQQYLRKLPEQPVFAVIFGSTAKETFSKFSDIDILLIGNRRINTDDAEKEADALSAVKISTFQMNYNEFIREIKLKEDKVIQSALATGYPLINHIAYYEALNERI